MPNKTLLSSFKNIINIKFREIKFGVNLQNVLGNIAQSSKTFSKISYLAKSKNEFYEHPNLEKKTLLSEEMAYLAYRLVVGPGWPVAGLKANKSFVLNDHTYLQIANREYEHTDTDVHCTVVPPPAFVTYRYVLYVLSSDGRTESKRLIHREMAQHDFCLRWLEQI